MSGGRRRKRSADAVLAGEAGRHWFVAVQGGSVPAPGNFRQMNPECTEIARAARADATAARRCCRRWWRSRRRHPRVAGGGRRRGRAGHAVRAGGARQTVSAAGNRRLPAVHCRPARPGPLQASAPWDRRSLPGRSAERALTSRHAPLGARAAAVTLSTEAGLVPIRRAVGDAVGDAATRSVVAPVRRRALAVAGATVGTPCRSAYKRRARTRSGADRGARSAAAATRLGEECAAAPVAARIAADGVS